MVMEMSSSNDVVNPSSADDDESVAEAVLEETNGRKKQTNADKSVFHKVLHKIQEVRKLCGKGEFVSFHSTLMHYLSTRCSHFNNITL